MAEQMQPSMEPSIQEDNKKSVECSDAEGEKLLEYAQELMERGSKASKEGDYAEAVDCFSRALEIRAAHYGELATECVDAYYKYGRALLYKAQDEADPLGAVPKKEAQSKQDSDKCGLDKGAVIGESSIPSNAEEDGSSNPREAVPNDDSGGKYVDEDDEGSDAEDTAEADEDESDLDLAWKMLDVARAIVEKHSGETMEKVDILSSLAEVALEREDVETSLSDYLKALSILEVLVEPDSRHIAELNFRICLCLEVGSKAQEAIPYCEKAIATCKSRVQRLTDEAKSVDSVADKGEIETLKGLSDELEKKLEDLQQLVSNPTSILTDILGLMSAKARGNEKSAPAIISSLQMGTAHSSGDFESSIVSTANTNGAAGVTHLGVVGRGVKRVLMNSVETESSSMKKPAA